MENCVYINSKFQEEYKKLDKLCKDCFKSNEGVSEYIREMDEKRSNFQRFAISSSKDYQNLKHIRWIRNQLAHEVGTLQSNLVTKRDLDFVMDFYNRIINREDPLAKLRESQESERKESERKKVAQRKLYDDPIDVLTKRNTPVTERKKQTFFSKLSEKIKKLFN